MIRKKRRLWQNYSSKEYYTQDYGSLQEQRVKAEVKNAKRKFERKLAKHSRKNSKLFCSYLKKSTSNRMNVGPLTENHGMVTDSRDMAESLNDQGPKHQLPRAGPRTKGQPQQ